MIILACETSTLLGSVAVLKDQVVLAYKDSYRQGSHSDVLNIFIEQALAEAKISLDEVDLFVSGIGPGSFTGIRISLNAIKTFSYCYNKPCTGINSLQNLAFSFLKHESENLPIVSMINAYKNMVYVATYKKEKGALVTLKEPSVVRVQNLDAYLDSKSYLVGDAFNAYKEYFEKHLSAKIVRLPDISDEPDARNLGLLAFDSIKSSSLNWNELVPVYLRESEAEENAKGIKYQPLF